MQQVRLSDDMISFETVELEGLGHEGLLERYQRLARAVREGACQSPVIEDIRSKLDSDIDVDVDG